MHSSCSKATSPCAARPPAEAVSKSCVACRSRKIKCDRQRPCGRCTHSQLDCVYPAGRGRAPKRPRNTRDKQLLARLSDLEKTIKNIARGKDGEENTSEEGTQMEIVEEATPLVEEQLSRLVVGQSQSYYVSNVLWARLGDEIDELRDLLQTGTSEDEDAESPYKSPEAEDPTSLEFGADAMIMGFQSLTHTLQSFHPPGAISALLWSTFKENIAPLVRIFHMPTLEPMVQAALSASEPLEKNLEALIFAIYYSTVISMDHSQCLDTLGTTRERALENWRFATQQAMARANLLNTQNLVLLQAAVIFLSALRYEDDSRTAWSLTALVYHIAQVMGLHRDGEAFGLAPLEVELRRRLWWHICLLDNRSSEHHGCEPIVSERNFDTRMPLNINDVDITPLTKTPPTERTEATDMTYCLIRCQAMCVMWKIGYFSPRSGASSDLAFNDISQLEREKLALELESTLEDRYIKYCLGPSSFQYMCRNVSRLIIARIHLIVEIPRCQERPIMTSVSSQGFRDRLFWYSSRICEQSSALLTYEGVSPWKWHCQTHIQWHAVAVVLSELIQRPASQECDRAWEHVSVIYNECDVKKTGGRGTLWRPIKRLMAKARAARNNQSTSEDNGLREVPDLQKDVVQRNGEAVTPTGSRSDWVPTPGQHDFSGQTFSALAEMLPDDFVQMLSSFGGNEEYSFMQTSF